MSDDSATPQWQDTTRDESAPEPGTASRIVAALDDDTRRLVRLSAVICTADEPELRTELLSATRVSDPETVEELILQSYLFAGLPRALNAMREWRRASGRKAPPRDEDAARDDTAAWRARGEVTCATVYGRFYERLRHNIAELHPALDEWMIVEGYGKVLARSALDLKRRELCIVAACAALRQERQLHSHLHGALNAGATRGELDATLAALRDVLPGRDVERAERLWRRVGGHLSARAQETD
ncbi:Carboxymuconolactone decarboxylase [Gemmatirosa kalamazoonensis]|uniref:Carboxymuconolactone decarboxylase n=1 Tax=Gemmatirosa kalamazoonensis TaxID=861299 RepID=W0RL05_9BACT|nr:carboxymuconolactone decarboxylase family protein [Gemmatirosa kalamazoonensis]AHG91010.1 Carboxymuconolactone decarboxylase [Gemmatirosa kalamazoonensis]